MRDYLPTHAGQSNGGGALAPQNSLNTVSFLADYHDFLRGAPVCAGLSGLLRAHLHVVTLCPL